MRAPNSPRGVSVLKIPFRVFSSKNLFKGAATQVTAKPGPFQEFYTALLAKGIRPEMARLTLARKIAAISLTIWKKGVDFDPKQLQRQAA
jgi:transposase